MRFWLGVTDNNWFDFLARRGLEEVNFWQPSGKAPFTKAPTGMPFLFKLKRPFNHVAGGGYFVTFSTLPVSVAWEVFGEKNGASSLDELRAMIAPLTPRDFGTDEIGCTVLSNVVFLPEIEWLNEPPGWSGNIVRGKMYESDDPDGALIWRSFQREWEVSAPSSQTPGLIGPGVQQPVGGYGQPTLVRPRLGQSSFRVLVTDAYKRRCAFTGESTLVALEAAHIVPFAREGEHDVRNGLLLRADFHRLFDVGLVSVTPDLKIRVSPRIREAWFNGKAYYRLDSQPLSVLPDRMELRPDPDRLEWHFKNRFQA
jgi:putative restriction endonuclease